VIAALAAAFSLTTSAFHTDGTIPRAYTCDGRDSSPPLHWTAPPHATRTFSLTMVDLDAGFVHWRVTGIPVRVRSLRSGAHVGHETTNDFGRRGYGGACPPRGAGLHRYVFTLRAVAASGRVLSAARVLGRYGR
jgi:Raf kinase inhibitor-like YbhB/YbcL family protein